MTKYLRFLGKTDLSSPPIWGVQTQKSSKIPDTDSVRALCVYVKACRSRHLFQWDTSPECDEREENRRLMAAIEQKGTGCLFFFFT